MKKTLLFISLLTICFSTFSQDIEKIKDSVVEEGKRMYKSEMASWYGTDIFLEKYPSQRANIGGYFSYVDADVTKCIFFSKDETPKVIATISFDSTYKISTAKVEDAERSFSEYENEIYIVRKKALSIINGDTLFKSYSNTNLNLIPLVSDNEKKVYVLTGPESNDVVIFGNDYLLTFDQENNLIEKKRLHKNIIPLNYGTKDGATIVSGMHSHQPETGDIITPTDICTLMLYEKLAKWKQHYVISKNYVSIWDCEKNTLATLIRDAWDSINKDQNKKKKRKD